MSKPNYIDRPPRIQPDLPSGDFQIPSPPEKKEGENQAIIQVALPMITIVGYIMVSVFAKGSNNMLMIIPMGIAVVASILVAIYTMGDERRKIARKDAAYAARLVELRHEMEGYHQAQRLFYNYNYPSLETSLRMAADLTRPADERVEDSRSGSRLWERRSGDKDFASLRLGIGALPSTVTYSMEEIENWDDPMIRDAIRLAQDSRYVSDVPIVIPLRQPPEQEDKQPEGGEKAPAARHAIGIAGANLEGVYQYVRGLIVDFAAYHSPTDAQIYVVGSYEARNHWRWAFSLPHCKEGGRNETLTFEEEQEKKGEKEADRISLFWRNLRTILERRKVRLADKESGGDVTLPFLLIVVDTLNPLPEWSSLRDLESEAAISLIMQEGPRLGAAILFLVPDRTKVPSACTAVIEADVSASGAIFRYAETGVNTPRYVGKADLIPTQEAARDFAKALEPQVVRMSYGADLATSVTLLEMMNIPSVDDLNAVVGDYWTKSRTPQAADWLSAHIGLLAGNEPRKLTFSAKADGVHGLVAGSTGSGKSELLMTLVIGLSLNYDPSALNFVLVDYKGGAAFEPFRRLPHCVDIVTNLDASATGRFFASIKAELDRRQRLNTFTDSKDIVHYRKKGLHQEKNAPPYPFLFIIIDEFAEMIAGNAEFKSQLESITRLGRALGVHLILAAQRPIGVTDQMRANIKFRICLRVETPEDSRELLRRADAAFLPPGIPGRGYLQVGNENIELIQTAYTGGDYRGPQEAVSPNVVWLNRPKKSDLSKKTEPPKLYDVIVEMMANRAKEGGSDHQWRPWPAFLPRQLTLQSPIDAAYMTETDVALLRENEPASSGETTPTATGAPLCLNAAVEPWLKAGEGSGWRGVDWSETAMRPVVGLLDNPYDARQLPLAINLPVGHAVIFGASGWGKTTFLRSLMVSLVATHSPDELQIYILDMGGRTLSAFIELPHVGAVINSDEEERMQRLLRRLGSILEKRQNLLAEAGVPDIYAYNAKHPESILPAILVVVDNFAELKENYETLVDAIISLVRDCRAYGIHFVFTGDAPGALPSKLFNLVTERMTLRLSDAGSYSDIVGRGVPEIGQVPGRGLVRVGSQPLEFQVALPVGVSEDERAKGVDEGEKLKRIFGRMKEAWGDSWKGERPASIETLPLRISLERTLSLVAERPANRVLATLGLDDQDLLPYLVDLQRQGPHFVVIGPPNSGKTTSIRSLVLSLAACHSPDEVMMVLIDFQRRFFEYGGKAGLGKLPHVVQTITKPEQVEELVKNLQYECQAFETGASRRKIVVVIDNYDSFSDDTSRKSRTAIDDLAVLAREYGTSGLNFVMCGSIAALSAPDELRKQILSSSFGLGLQSADGVGRLNGRVPRSLAEAELPIGRGFIVKSGRTSMLQVATPYASDDNVEGSLDAWIEQICVQYQGRPLAWSRPPEPEQPAGEAGGPAGGSPAVSGAVGTVAGAAPVASVSPEALEAAKAVLLQNGFGEDLIGALRAEDIVAMAAGFGPVVEEKLTPEVDGNPAG